MTLHSYSGGTFYLPALAHGAALAQTLVPPSAYVGISSGLLIAIVSAVHGTEKMLQYASTVNLLKAVTVRPFNEKGKPTPKAFIRFVTNRNIVVQDTKPLMRQIITKDDFFRYKCSSSPSVYTTLYNLYTKKLEKFNLKAINCYEKFLLVIDAGVAAQGLVKPVKIGANEYSEGGAKDHNAGHRFIKELSPTTYVSLYSRPENWERTPGKVKGAIPQLFDMIECDNQEKSINDEQREKSLCKDLGIKAYWGYSDRTLSHPYSTDKLEINRAIVSMRRSIQTNITV